MKLPVLLGPSVAVAVVSELYVCSLVNWVVYRVEVVVFGVTNVVAVVKV